MNALVPTVEEIKLYYSGFNAIARFVEDKNHWECTVLNSADPIDFRTADKEKLHDTLVEYLHDYREYCKHMGKYAHRIA